MYHDKPSLNINTKKKNWNALLRLAGVECGKSGAHQTDRFHQRTDLLRRQRFLVPQADSPPPLPVKVAYSPARYSSVRPPPLDLE